MCSSPRVYKTEGGFTLVEVLLVVAIMGIMASMAVLSLTTSVSAIDATRTQAVQQRMIRSALQAMSEDLTVGVSRVSAPWMGMNGQQDGRPSDTVAFLSHRAVRSPAAIRESELVHIVYAREGDRLLRVARTNIYGLTDESLDRIELADHVAGFNVRYYDASAQAWRDEWDGQARKTPPRALLIELSLLQGEEEPRTVRQWVLIGDVAS